MAKPQEFTDALRKGDAVNTLKLTDYIFSKYSTALAPNPMTADVIMQLACYELSQTDISDEDLTQLKFLFHYVEKTGQQKAQNDITTLIAAVGYAISIKNDPSFMEIVELKSKNDVNELLKEESSFSRLISNSNEKRQKNDDFVLQPITKQDVEAMKKVLVGDSSDSKYVKTKHDEIFFLATCAIELGGEGANVFKELIKNAKYKETVQDFTWEDPPENQYRTYDTGLLDPVKVYFNKEVERPYLGSEEDRNKLIKIALDEGNIQVINLLVQQGSRLTHEQFTRYATKVVENINLDESLEGDFFDKIQPFFTKLQELENKIEDLNVRGFPKDANKAKELSNNIRSAIVVFIDKEKPDCYLNADKIISRCDEHIQNVKPYLETHRGWKPFFEELIGVMTLFVSKVVTLIATGGDWSLTDSGVIKTDSAKLMNNMSDTFKNMKEGLNKLKEPNTTNQEPVNSDELDLEQNSENKRTFPS